jgi:glutamate-1-semialdehyde 2,1-aminomutase
VIERADGPHVWDADGQRLIDLNMGYGPLLFGHRPDFIRRAIVEVIDQLGTSVGFPHPLSHQAAELIKKSFPSIDLLRFSSSGTEAVQTAVRLARAHTGRQGVVLFEGHYHGSSHDVFHRYHAPLAELDARQGYEALPGTRGLGLGLGNARVLPWNDGDLLEDYLARHGDEVAAVLMEPVMGNAGVVPPRDGFLERARAAVDRCGALLVFDEVITGFRVARGGAQERYGVRADVTVLSKAMNGGVPVSAVGGRREVFRHMETGKVFHGGVFSGNPLCLAATLAVQEELDRRGHEIYPFLEARSRELAEGLETIFREAGIPIILQRVGPMVSLWFASGDDLRPPTSYREVRQRTDPERYVRFQHALQRAGVYVHPNHFECWFLATVHGESVLGEVLDRVAGVARKLDR